MLWRLSATSRLAFSLKRKIVAGFFLLPIGIILGSFAPAVPLAQESAPRDVLILHSYHPGLIWTDNIMSGIMEVFGQEGDQLHLHVEYLDTQRYENTENYEEILGSLIHYKLKDRQFDLLLLSDNNALEFVQRHRTELFSHSSVVFCGINNFRPSMIEGSENITGVAEYPSIFETIETALDLHPETDRVIVIGGQKTLTSLENRNMLVSLLIEEPFDPSVRFIFWDDLPSDELTSRLKDLPDNSLVLINGSVSRRSGEALPYLEGIRIISECSRPVYSLWDFSLGNGIVGGKLISGRQQGRIAAQMAMRILDGEDPDNIPVAVGPNRYMFDYDQMKRFGLSIRGLPKDSIVINRPPPFYALSRGQLLAALAVLSGLSALLFANVLVRRRTQKKLEEQKERVDLLLDSAAEAIYGVDLQGKCTFCNPAALRMLGFRSEQDLLGKKVHELVHHTRPNGMPYPSEECRVCKAFRRGENLHVENEHFWRADGSSFPAEYWSYPIRKDGQTIGAVVTFLDISERKEAENKSKEALQELNAFVYTVSHDLRSPLSAIIGFADFLRQNYTQVLDENGNTALEEIEAQSERMDAMMEDLLSLSSVGKLPAPPSEVDVNEVVGKVVRDLHHQIAEAGLAVRIGPLPSAKIPETLLSQIFSNLIGNAVRYAGEEGGPIEVDGERSDSTVRFFVRDHGPGIPPGERLKVFDVFFRGSTGKRISGTGIGLATVQKIARLYGGRVWIEDTPAGGATFAVELVESA